MGFLQPFAIHRTGVFLFFKRWFTDFKELDYARSGNVATYDLKLDAGILRHYHDITSDLMVDIWVNLEVYPSLKWFTFVQYVFYPIRFYILLFLIFLIFKG